MNASDQFFSGGKSLNYGPTSDQRWLNRPRGGLIVSEPRESQQTDINTRAPLFWDEGRTQPKMQLSFDVICDGSGPAAANGWQTSERVDQADNGRRTVYVKGKDKVEAIKAQLTQHARTGLRIGDYYYEVWTGTRPGQNNIGTARTWAVVLFPGAGVEQASFFGNEPQPPQAPPAQQGPPAGFGQQYQQPAAPSVQAWGQPQGAPAPAPQGNAYGYGHQPPASPGGQAYANAQQAPQGQFQSWGAEPPQFQPPAQAQYQQPGNPVGAAPHPGATQQYSPGPQADYAAPTQTTAPQQFGQPVPPVDDPWGAVAPAQNPYGG